MSTKIEWTDETWNPITGCSPVSEGCQNCYAKRMANRLKGRYGYPKDNPFKVTLHRNRLDQPLKWKKPRRIFVCSMGDIFHEDVRVAWIDSIIGMIEQCSHHTFLILTKRPENIEEKVFAYYHNGKRQLFQNGLPKNVWLGITAENQKRADERVPILMQIPARVRFVSVEPMLEYIDLMHGFQTVNRVSSSQDFIKKDGIDWAICGAETGPGARHMDDKWAFDLFRQCKAAKVPFFFKKASKGSVLNWNKHEFPAT